MDSHIMDITEGRCMGKGALIHSFLNCKKVLISEPCLCDRRRETRMNNVKCNAACLQHESRCALRLHSGHGCGCGCSDWRAFGWRVVGVPNGVQLQRAIVDVCPRARLQDSNCVGCAALHHHIRYQLPAEQRRQKRKEKAQHRQAHVSWWQQPPHDLRPSASCRRTVDAALVRLARRAWSDDWRDRRPAQRGSRPGRRRLRPAARRQRGRWSSPGRS